MKELYIRILEELDYRIFLIDTRDCDFFKNMNKKEETNYLKVNYQHLIRARKMLLN